MESNSECFFGRMRALDLYMHDKSDARSLPVKEKKKEGENTLFANDAYFAL